MANILSSTYVNNGFNQNATQYDIIVALDSSISSANINLYLPNNGDRYKTVEHINEIPTGSLAIIYTTNEMLVCSFVAQHGSINSSTTMKTGIWYCIGKKTYITS